jgi:uncharacterized repeat protein (TIGR03803 family)
MCSTARIILHCYFLMIVALAWTLPVLAQGGEGPIYSFGNDASHGNYPIGKLVFDKNGNLYGTTYSGGTGSCPCGCGAVFELMPLGAGT